METLVAVAHHKNHQYHGGSRSHGSTRFESSSPPTRGFRGINCRTFHSGEGLLSAPVKSSSNKIPITKKAFCPSLLPETPLSFLTENPKISKQIAKSSSVPIPFNLKFENKDGQLPFSELWAGPAYSNSPPPSALPIPNFSLRPKRTVSLDLPTVVSEIDLSSLSKSAPTSPRERSPSPNDLFNIADSATRNLRRMLNLDIDDE